MCELLVLRKDLAAGFAGNHPHRSLISTPGEIITVQEDDYPWHPETAAPDYHSIIVKVPGVPIADIVHWFAPEASEHPALGEPEKLPRQRMYHLPIERLRPLMNKHEIEALLTRPESIYK